MGICNSVSAKQTDINCQEKEQQINSVTHNQQSESWDEQDEVITEQNDIWFKVKMADPISFKACFKVETQSGKNQKLYIQIKDYNYFSDTLQQPLNGFSTQQYSFGQYEGEFKNDLFHGYGKITYKDGSRFEGQFVQGCAQGYGRMLKPNGNCYVGDWENNQQHGYGKETILNVSTYQGQFVKGLKHGKGHIDYDDGSYYQGCFENDQVEGQGYYRCADGMEYHGNWLKNEFDGQGVLKWPDGRRYEGGFKAGLKNGYGIYIYRDGSRYEGNWLDGKQDGQGIFYSKQGKAKTVKYCNGSKENLIVTSPVIGTNPQNSSGKLNKSNKSSFIKIKYQ